MTKVRLVILAICLLGSAPRDASAGPLYRFADGALVEQEASAELSAVEIALSIAGIWKGGTDQKKISPCGADGDPATPIAELGERAQKIAVLLGPHDPLERVERDGESRTRAPWDDEQDRYQAWKLANLMKYGLEKARGALACGPEADGKPALEAELEHALIADADLLVASLAANHGAVQYGFLPEQPFSIEGVVQDVIDVFELYHYVDVEAVRKPGEQPAPETLDSLRPLVYAPAVTAIRYAGDWAQPLEELRDAVEANTELQTAKRELLLLKIQFAIDWAAYSARWSQC